MSILSRLRAVLEERMALMAPARRLRLAQVTEAVERRLGPDAELRVFDAGCGDGLLSLAMAKAHPSWSITGIDLRDDLLGGARQRAAARHLTNASFVEGNLERPLPVGDANAVLAVECLSEIPDDRRAMEMMAAALAPGGLLVVQVPERDWQPVLPGSADTWREQVRQGYTAEGLEAALRGLGLEDVRVRPTYRSLAAGAQEIRDRIKDRGLLLRLIAFPFMVAAVRLERLGITFGRPNALLAVGSRTVG